MGYLKELEEKFNSVVESLKEEFLGLRTNRPTPKLIENIKVDYMGQPLIVKQLGAIGIELPRDLIVNVWDKNAVPMISKAIEAANIGVSASMEGNSVRVKLPELTNERRDELIKIVKSSAEKCRIKMRTLRDDANKSVNAETDKDIKFRSKEEMQKIVDSFNQSIDEVVEKKIKEISD